MSMNEEGISNSVSLTTISIQSFSSERANERTNKQPCRVYCVECRDDKTRLKTKRLQKTNQEPRRKIVAWWNSCMNLECTKVQNSHELGHKYWATCLTIRSVICSALLASLARFAALICSLAHSLTYFQAREKVANKMSQIDLFLSHRAMTPWLPGPKLLGNDGDSKKGPFRL